MFGNNKGVAHLGLPIEMFLVGRGHHADNCPLDVVDSIIDYIIEPDINTLRVRQFLHLGIRSDIETKHNGMRGCCKHNIRFGYRAGRGMNNINLHL